MSQNLGKNHWRKDAACKDADVKLFTSFDVDSVREALEYCKRCTVRLPCLMDGFESPWIAGGTTKFDRLMEAWHRVDSVEESNFDD